MSALGIVPVAEGIWVWEPGIFLPHCHGSLCSPTARPSEEVGPGGGGTQGTIATPSSRKATRKGALNARPPTRKNH
jgi:hypothetical protein